MSQANTPSRQTMPLRTHGPGGGPPGMLRGGEKARDFKGTMKKLVRYLGPYKFHFLVVLLLAVASTVFNIV